MKNSLKKILLYILPERLKIMITKQQSDANAFQRQFQLTSFSQQAEDLHIQRYFGNRNNGFYVDVGAFHPLQISNTQLFYNRGWRGINIEPNPDQFAFFPQYRPQDTNLNLAVGNAGETLTYHCFNVPGLNSFSQTHATDWANREGFYITHTLQISTVTLAEILAQHLPKNQTIDFMSVDAEGWDLIILTSNN
ncbi:MAG: FkbM family methyltransferase, partial [Bacteroidia bacterium]